MEELTVFTLVSFLVLGAAASQRPNIILIIADDLGFTDVGFHGSQQIPTPNLDSFAYDGIIMNNYYVQQLCTPTRSALLTSRYPIHTGLQHGVILGANPYGLPLNETLLPQYLKELGYRTHMVGKWHLGFYAKEYTPLYRGFDSHFGYYCGAEDYWDHTSWEGIDLWGLDFRDQMEVGRNYFGQYSTETYSQRAQKIIREHNNTKPLFLYLPFQSVHSANPYQPLQAPEEYIKRMSHIKHEKRRTFAAMVSAMDDAIGNITATLSEQGLLNNSVIIFSTDNGGPAGGFDMNYASNYPLRGMKALLWEGGTRGASFIWSPLLQKSSYISNHMVHVTDWLPTILNVTGYNMGKLQNQKLDGVNVWNTLSSNTSTSPRSEILMNIDSDGSYAIRVDNMKLIYGKSEASKYGTWVEPETVIDPEFGPKNMLDVTMDASSVPMDSISKGVYKSKVNDILLKLGRGRAEPHPAIVNCGEKPANASTNCNTELAPCLYDISKDPCEYNNLAHQMPDMVTKLLKVLSKYNETAVEPLNKPNDPKGYPKRHNGVWEPWVNISSTVQ